MKTIKSLTEAEIAELPPLPMEWKWVRLGEIHILKSDKYKGSGESLFYVGLEHINKDQGTLTEDVKVDVINTVKNSFKKGDLLYGKLRPYLNKVYLANEDGVCSTDILVFESTPSLNLNYSKYFFLSYKFVNDMTQNSSGVNLPRVSTKYLQECPFPLAPLPEQRAIVSKIEQLFSELDNGISNLKLAQEQLKVYRQAVLKKAFKGELTKKWREQQTDLPNAGNLLEQIKREREEAATVNKKKVKTAKPLTEEELEELPRLPEGWFWVKFSEACNIKSNLVSPGKYKNYPHIAPDNIERETGRLLKYRTIEDDQVFSPKHLFYKDQIIYSKIRPYLNKLIIAPFDGLCSADMYPIESCMITKYLFHFMLSEDFVNKASNSGSRTILPKINQVELGRIPIPLCSISEQQAIVQEIETRLSVCDKIEQDIETNLEKAEALRQSILKKAFEGKLLNEKELAEVRGAEDWEPAEVLLERIKAERAQNREK